MKVVVGFPPAVSVPERTYKAAGAADRTNSRPFVSPLLFHHLHQHLRKPQKP